jgi:hypothetical protein
MTASPRTDSVAGTIPLGYCVITVVNFAYFKGTKDFVTVRLVQVFISLALPFISLAAPGGFVDSGGVMLWAMLSTIVSGLTIYFCQGAVVPADNATLLDNEGVAPLETMPSEHRDEIP